MAALATKSVKTDYDQSLLQKMIKNKLDFCFIMYDDIADEFIIKLAEHIHPTSYCYLDDNSAVIVEIDTNRVVGVSFLNYEKNLAKEPEILDKWNSIKPDFIRTYRRVTLTKDVTSPDSLWVKNTNPKKLKLVTCLN